MGVGFHPLPRYCHITIVIKLGEAELLCFFVAVKLTSSYSSILFTSMSTSSFIVRLMLIQFSAKEEIDYIVKSAGVDPPV